MPLTALDAEIVLDIGSGSLYAGRYTMTLHQISELYRCANVRVRIVAVYTNTGPTGPQRGVLDPIATFSTEAAIDDLAARLVADGGDALAFACDVSVEADVDRLASGVLARFGRVDLLVNNAGITEVIAAEQEPLATFERVVATNLTGAFLCSQRFGRAMLAGGGGGLRMARTRTALPGGGVAPRMVRRTRWGVSFGSSPSIQAGAMVTQV